MTSPRDASPTAISKPSPRKSPSPSRVLLIFGTRPEAIKLCPLVSALRTFAEDVTPVVCVTGQHREMLHQVLSVFHVKPDIDLDLMTAGQTLPALTSRLLTALEPILQQVRPAVAVVQGDTTTTFCGALSAFYARVPVAHVEAGLRTGDPYAPFPEEANRTLTSKLARLHFAPTRWAAENLLREGIPSDRVLVTGNTGIDAVLAVSRSLEQGELQGLSQQLDPAKKLIVVTAHRRENFGEAFQAICHAMAGLAERPDVQIVWPVHPNPNVRETAHAVLGQLKNVLLIDPLTYVPFVDLLRRSFLILTDSGGIQEEAPSLGKPVLVLREKTERPEGVEAGTVRLVGCNQKNIVRECSDLLDHPSAYQKMTRVHNPYGNGTASEAIARHLVTFLANHSG